MLKATPMPNSRGRAITLAKFSRKPNSSSRRNRRSGTAKLKIKEMGSRYLFICFYVWLEKYFSRGDYRRSDALVEQSGNSDGNPRSTAAADQTIGAG